MIENVVPDCLASCDVTGSFAECSLFPEEESAIGKAAPRRRREFAAGRICARNALLKLGVAVGAILRGRNGEPVWPDGTAGSITHCQGYCGAAVGPASVVHAIGIDAEVNEPLPSGTSDLVIRRDERESLNQLPAGAVCWDRLLFSAKESLYKAWFPIERCWLDFEEAQISIVPQTNTFAAQILRSASNPVFQSPVTGRFIVAGGFILTSLVIHRVDVSSRSVAVNSERITTQGGGLND